jgi:tRNA-dihydrouridine synthase B
MVAPSFFASVFLRFFESPYNKVVFLSQMKIGNVDLGFRPVVLAPMEDVTDLPFRALCRKMGAAMVYSEFVSSDALVRMVNKSLAKLEVNAGERPVAIQIYGKTPEAMADAAKIVVEQAHPDVLDINFGCPVKKVAGKGAGAGLLRNVPLMLEIARAVVDAVNIPVTAKTRLGWDHDSIIVEQLAEQLQDCGIQALTIHGRTRSQVYNGVADWEPIRKVRQNPRIKIPVIGNGDICSGSDALRRFNETGVDAVMVGRATFGRPWIFAEINRELGKDISELGYIAAGGHEPLSLDWKLDVLEEEVRQSVERNGPVGGLIHMRRHIAASPLFKGIPDFRPTRIAMLRCESIDAMLELMEGTRPLLCYGNESTNIT